MNATRPCERWTMGTLETLAVVAAVYVLVFIAHHASRDVAAVDET